MATIDLQPVARDMGALVYKLTNELPTVVRTVPVDDVRRLTAASLADLDLVNGNGSLKQVVQDSTKNLDSKETGFIAYALDVLRGLFVQKREDRSKEEIKSALKEKIPTLNIPRNSENIHGGQPAGSFTFTTVEDKAGAQYNVTLWVSQKDYSPESLRIISFPEYPHFDTSIPLTGTNVDTEILKLIQDNPNILPEKK